MSFTTPRNVPNFASSTTRRHEDVYWSSSGRSRYTSGGSSGANGAGGISISPFPFRGRDRELPMYKDKPYSYPFTRRRRSWRFWVSLVLLGLFCWLYLAPRLLHGREKGGGKGAKGGAAHAAWAQRREDVVGAMKKSWGGYEKYAWGKDEYYPNTKSGRYMVPPTGLGWIIVDALDTLMLMNMTKELSQAREWISSTLTYDLDHDVNTFETTIRMLGGFLSAHYFQTSFPKMCPVDLRKGGEDLYLEKAADLAKRLLGAFDTPTGIPYASINLHTSKGIASHEDRGSSSLAEATSVQLEMKYLAKLTGEKNFWDKAEKVMESVDKTTEPHGLKGIFISPQSGEITSNNIRLGSRGDSYYEYLIKQYYQTSKEEPIYLDMWDEALAGMKKHLITYSHPSNFTVLAERPWGIAGELHPKMDHLVCFMPGTLALSTTGGLTVQEAKKRNQWSAAKQENLDLAIELMKTCWGMYKVTKTGLAPEITFFRLPPDAERRMYNDKPRPKSPEKFDPAEDAKWRQDFTIKPADSHNLQRPETVESLFYLWRITRDEKYREWGWEMFQAFMKHTEAPDDAGYTSIDNVNDVPTHTRNNMESFWPAETLKYFFLLFSPDDLLPLDAVVFNTEAHPFPRFQLGKLFSTGWRRHPRSNAASAGSDSSGLKLHEVTDQKPLAADKKADVAADEHKKTAH